MENVTICDDLIGGNLKHLIYNYFFNSANTAK